MNRSRAYRRHQKYRWRAKVRHIVKNIWHWSRGDFEKWGEETIQGMEKNRRQCDCYMCNWKNNASGPQTLRGLNETNEQLKDLNYED